jgi:hypothetical protein
MVFAAICVLTGLAMLLTEGDLFGVFFAAAVITFGAAAVWVYFQWRVRQLAEGWGDPFRLMAFANDNGFHAVPVAGPAELPGRIFGRGLEANRVRHDVVAWVQSGRQCQIATESWHSGEPGHGGLPADEGSRRYLAVRISDQALPLTVFDALGYPSVEGPPEDDTPEENPPADEPSPGDRHDTSDEGAGPDDAANVDVDAEAGLDDNDADPHWSAASDEDRTEASDEDVEATGMPWQLMATPGAEEWAQGIFGERMVRLLTDSAFPRDAEIVGEWFIAYDIGEPEPLSISHWERTFALVASLPEYPVAPPAASGATAEDGAGNQATAQDDAGNETTAQDGAGAATTADETAEDRATAAPASRAQLSQAASQPS